MLLTFSSCSKFQKILKSNDHAAKYEAALKYYEKKDYFRTIQLLDELIYIYRGTNKAEKIMYIYAYCYYNEEDYIMAAYHFASFVEVFPRSEFAEECQYMSALCKYKDSPHFTLDQTSTVEAIKDFQLFVNVYPKSTRIEECNTLMDELRQKLEKKAFQISYLYFKIESYKSSIIAFKNLLKDFPDTKYREESMFYIVKANYIYASKSIDAKKKERYTAAVEAFKNMKNIYTEGKYFNLAKEINVKAELELKKL